MKPIYKRILLKISGEALMGEEKFGVSDAEVMKLAKEIAKLCKKGLQIAIVLGGGNIFRGTKDASKEMDRSVADQIGMMGTVINGLFLHDVLKRTGVDARLMSSLDMPRICESYSYAKALSYLESGKVVIFAGGTGSPYFTTDTGACLKASEMHVDVLLKATQVDGVYNKDPKKYADAKKYDAISYNDFILQQLKIMDITAVAMAKENNIPVVVFSRLEKNAFENVVCGKGNYSVIGKEV